MRRYRREQPRPANSSLQRRLILAHSDSREEGVHNQCPEQHSEKKKNARRSVLPGDNDQLAAEHARPGHDREETGTPHVIRDVRFDALKEAYKANQ